MAKLGEQTGNLAAAARLNKPIRPDDLRGAFQTALGNSALEIPHEATTPRGHGQRPLRILVAEDNAVNQKLAVAILRRMGHQVTLASTGVAAVESWRREAFDLVLMDVQMPEMDGFEATRKIRALEQSSSAARTPIIAMTAHAMGGDRERCLQAGMDEHVPKPINRGDLASAMPDSVGNGIPGFGLASHCQPRYPSRDR